MLPEDGTVDAIFRVVKALNERQHKTWKKRLKSSYSSLRYLLTLWIPSALFILAWGLVIINIWAKSLWVGYGGLLLLFLAPVSYAVGNIIGLWTTTRDTLSLSWRIERVREVAHTDTPHVTELFRYPRQDLQYVLVELKAERAAWERSVGVVVGAQEKIGIIPAVARDRVWRASSVYHRSIVTRSDDTA